MINPQQPALNVALPFVSTNFVIWSSISQEESLEFPINLLSSFCSTGFQGVTHLLSKLTPSPMEDFRSSELQHGGW